MWAGGWSACFLNRQHNAKGALKDVYFIIVIHFKGMSINNIDSYLGYQFLIAINM